MEPSAVLFAFLLTVFAGLSTGVGSLIALLRKRTNTRLLSYALGFSAGVMIYVSFVEIFVKAKDSLVAALGNSAGSWATAGAFFGGIVAMVGARMADGCPSGHGLSGMMQLSVSAFVALAMFFGVGVLVAHIVYGRRPS